MGVLDWQTLCSIEMDRWARSGDPRGDRRAAEAPRRGSRPVLQAIGHHMPPSV